MKTEEIIELFRQFESIANEYEGVECWSARELAKLLGYAQWRNFENIVNKAKAACEHAEQEVSYHFAEVGKMVSLGSGSEREVSDYMLTRYACYLVAQNGDPRKPQVAFAQNYFAVQNWYNNVSSTTNGYKRAPNLQKQKNACPVYFMNVAWTAKALPLSVQKETRPCFVSTRHCSKGN